LCESIQLIPLHYIVEIYFSAFRPWTQNCTGEDTEEKEEEEEEEEE